MVRLLKQMQQVPVREDKGSIYEGGIRVPSVFEMAGNNFPIG